MQKLITFLEDNLSLSPPEARQVFLLMCTLIVFMGIRLSFTFFTNPTLSEVEIKQYDQTITNAYTTHSKNQLIEKESIKKKKPINPNTASLTELEELGFPSFLANRLINFRNKGKVYKRKEDLLDIYGMEESLFSKIEPFILLPTSLELAALNQTVQEELVPPKESVPKTQQRTKNTIIVDINQANKEELLQVHGIGEVFANRIIKYRDLLGGFYQKEQLKETYGLPESAYDSLQKVMVFKTKVTKININQLEAETFRHPYLKSYQVKGIANYIKQHGPLEDMEDLQKIRVLDKETINKVSPYLSFQK